MTNLPKATKEISEHPSKGSVTQPSSAAEMERDVDRKMRFYGVLSGFRQGKLPSNKQAEETLDYLSGTAPFDTSKLSREGQELVEQARAVIQDAKKLLLVKNQDELIQNFIWNTREIDVQSHKENLKSTSAPVDKETARSEGQEAVQNLRVIAKLLFTNSEVRKLLSDVTVLGRDVAADAAQNAANKARPHEDSLRNADEPGPDSQWIGPDGEKRGPHDRVPDTGIGAKVDQAKQKKEEVKQDARQQAEEQRQRSEQRANNEVDPNNREQQQQVAREEAGGAADRAKGLANKHLPDSMNRDNLRGTAQNQVNQTKDYFKDKFPEERRDKFIYRLKKVIAEQQKHDDFNNAIDFFIDQFYNYKGRAADVANQGQGKGGDIRSDPAYANAEMSLRILLERFANNTSMQPILDAVDVLYTDAKHDDDLRAWWSDAGKYIRRLLQEDEYVLSDQSTQDGKDLNNKGKRFFDERYRSHREDLFNSIEEFAYAYNEDPLNKKLGEDVKKTIKMLLYNSDGGITYKPHLISDLRHIIIPQVLGKVGYIPIPRAEYTDNQFNVVLENLVVEMSNIIPNIIEIENHNRFRLSAYDNLGDHQEHRFKIQFEQVQADLKNIGFYFKKKTGFPKLQDSGLADVRISGKGIYGDIILETTPNRNSIFRVADVTIKIDDLKWKIQDSKHNFLYNMMRTTASGLVKNAIAKAAQVAIRQALVQLDSQLTDIRDTARQGAESDDSTRAQALRERFAQKKAEADKNKEKAKAEADKRNSQFHLVTSRDQEKIPWESSSSHVGKQGTIQEHAQRSGDGGWRSEVFDITHPSPALNHSIAGQDASKH